MYKALALSPKRTGSQAPKARAPAPPAATAAPGGRTSPVARAPADTRKAAAPSKAAATAQQQHQQLQLQLQHAGNAAGGGGGGGGAAAAAGRGSGGEGANWSHKLEGDGLITTFYDFLLSKVNMKPCPGVMLPDTIVYNKNFPRGWYTTDLKSGADNEVMRRQGKDLDSETLIRFFSVAPHPNVGVVASYMSLDDSVDETTATVEFFNAATLKEFIERKEKRAGILQKFVVPKGGSRNTVIQAVWTPNPNAFFVWRRTNRMALMNKAQCERDPYPMCVTYDGPSHFSEESSCADDIKTQIHEKCKQITRHFFDVNKQQKVITRLVLYFKTDEAGTLWLLWCGGLRVADANSPLAAAARQTVPLNLAPRYTGSSLEVQRDASQVVMLVDANKKFGDLCSAKRRDPAGVPLEERPGEAGGSPHSSAGGGGASPDGRGRSAAGTAATTAAGAARAGAGAGAGVDGASGDLSGDAWSRNPQYRDAEEKLVRDRDQVLSYLDDVFYEAYGHFLRYEPGAFVFVVSKDVADKLGNDQLGEAMSAGGVQKASTSETSITNIDDEDLWFEIQPKHPKGPVSKIREEVKKKVRQYYEKRINEVREDSASTMLAPAAAAVAAAGASPAKPPSSSAATRPAAAAAAAAAAPAAAASAPAAVPANDDSDADEL
jgi:hypothetical protein